MWREKTREIFGRLERCSYLCTAIKEKHIPDDSCPDGGIGRRAGLKHQWSNPSRFDPGSGYQDGEKFTSLLFRLYTLVYIHTFIPAYLPTYILSYPPFHENVYSDLFRISLSIFGFSKDNIYLCRRNNLYIITQQTEK